MKYLSIIRFFEYCNIDYQELNLAKIKKIISVEYSLSDKGLIAIDGFDYTKDIVLQEIEKDNIDQRIKFHIKIWENKDFLTFLERDCINYNGSTWFDLVDNPEFKHFISPYFAYAFNKVMQKFYRDLNIIGASSLLKFSGFINYIDENEAFASTRAFISETLKLFRNTSESNYKKNLVKLNIWRHYNIILFIHNLPDSLSDEVEDIVIALINLTVKLQTKDKWLCFEISKNLIKINRIDPVNAEIIKKNHLVYKEKVSICSSLRRIFKACYFIIVETNLYVIIIIAFIVILNKCVLEKDETGQTPKYEKPEKKSTLNRLIERTLGAKNTEKKNQNKKIPYDPYLYDISHKEFISIRNKYSNILSDTPLVLIHNEAIPLLKENLYYFMIENNSNKEISGLRIVNKLSLLVDCNIEADYSTLIDFAVNQNDSGTLEVHNPHFDLIISFLDATRTRSVLKEKVIPVLISDSLNRSPHIIQTAYPDKMVHINNPEQIYDFTIEFSRDSIFIYGKDNHEIEWIYKQ